MKYKNTTANPIFIKLNGGTVVVASGEEISSKESLGSFGLEAFPVEKPKPTPPPKPTPKPNSVITNERKQFTNTDPSKD